MWPTFQLRRDTIGSKPFTARGQSDVISKIVGETSDYTRVRFLFAFLKVNECNRAIYHKLAVGSVLTVGPVTYFGGAVPYTSADA